MRTSSLTTSISRFRFPYRLCSKAGDSDCHGDGDGDGDGDGCGNGDGDGCGHGDDKVDCSGDGHDAVDDCVVDARKQAFAGLCNCAGVCVWV